MKNNEVNLMALECLDKLSAMLRVKAGNATITETMELGRKIIKAIDATNKVRMASWSDEV